MMTICLALLILSRPALSEELANVNGVSITTDDYKKNMAQVPPQMKGQISTIEEKERFLDRIVNMELLSQEAKKAGMDKDPIYIDELEQAKKEILVNLMAQKLNKEKVSEEAVRAYFNKNIKDFQLVHASHILVKTEEEANKIKKELSAGGNFSDLAKKYSIDTGSAKNGGDLGPPFNRKQMVPAFADLAFKLKPNEMGGPVKTQFGYHLIKVLEVKNPKFEEMTRESLGAIHNAIINEEIEKIKAKGKVTVNKEALKKVE